MKDICLQGYNSRYITMQADGKMEPGDLVVMSGNNTVKKAAAGKFVGVAHAVRGDYVLVQTGGFAVLPYSGTAPTVCYPGGGQQRRRYRQRFRQGGAGDRGGRHRQDGRCAVLTGTYWTKGAVDNEV